MVSKHLCMQKVLETFNDSYRIKKYFTFKEKHNEIILHHSLKCDTHSNITSKNGMKS